jgi:hypothetical protein
MLEFLLPLMPSMWASQNPEMMHIFPQAQITSYQTFNMHASFVSKWNLPRYSVLLIYTASALALLS